MITILVLSFKIRSYSESDNCTENRCFQSSLTLTTDVPLHGTVEPRRLST